jgi:hypothetical protein
MAIRYGAMLGSSAPAIPAGSVAAWLVATCFIAAAPALYFVAGASDSATESARIAYAAVPLAIAWLPLSLGLGLIHRRRTGRWGLPFGSPGRRAAALLLIATALLAIARTLADHTTIYGNGQWAAFWLVCGAAWITVALATARRTGR